MTTRLAAFAFAAALLLAPVAARAEGERWLAFFSLRAMGGGAAVFSSAGDVGGEFAADFSAGVRFFRARRDGRAWLLGPELGFSPLKRGDDITVLWQFGLSLGYGTIPLHVAWTPRFVVGAVDRADVLGVRNGILLTAFAGLACAELSHQYLHGADGDEHDLRVTLGVDVGMLVHRLIRSISDLQR